MKKRKVLKVFVAYGWQKFDDEHDTRKGNDSQDVFWKSIRDTFAGTIEGIEKDPKCRVHFSRLAPFADGYMLDGIIKRIKSADLLIFDFGSPTKTIKHPKRKIDAKEILKKINFNVVFEYGIAKALKKKCILLVPYHLRNELPSDISGQFAFFYKGKVNQMVFDRVFIEGNKMISTFRDLLVDKKGKRK